MLLIIRLCHIIRQLAVVNTRQAGPGCAASLLGDGLLVDSKLVGLLVGPLGTLPSCLGVLLCGVLFASFDVLCSKILLDGMHRHISCHFCQEFIVLRCPRLLLSSSLLARIGAHVVIADFWLLIISTLLLVPALIAALRVALTTSVVIVTTTLVVLLLLLLGLLVIVLLLLLTLIVPSLILLLLLVATLVIIPLVPLLLLLLLLRRSIPCLHAISQGRLLGLLVVLLVVLLLLLLILLVLHTSFK